MQARILDFISLWSPACAEGSVLSLFSFDKFKAEKKRKKIPAIKPLRLVMIRPTRWLTNVMLLGSLDQEYNNSYWY